MRPYVRFEAGRLFRDPRSLAVFIILILVTQYFVALGAQEYRRFKNDKALFLRYEKEKVSHYVNYTQYGGFGFRVLYEGAPLAAFFFNSQVLADVESNIDNFEAIRVEYSFKGKKLFLQRVHYRDFAGFLFLVGPLFMLYLGGISIPSLAYLKMMLRRISFNRFLALTTTVRLLLLDLFFILLVALALLLSRAAGLPFSRADIRHLLAFTLYLLLFLDFFYLLGFSLAALIRSRSRFLLWGLAAWFAAVFILPEIGRLTVFNRSARLTPSAQVDLDKFATLMEMEKKVEEYYRNHEVFSKDEFRQIQKQMAISFLNSGYLLNLSREKKYQSEVADVIRRFERQSLLFPSLYYTFLSGELSAKGYYGYLAFVDYILTLRLRFLRFFISKKYESNNGGQVESFVRADENVFPAPSLLPSMFWNAMAVVAAYCLAFFALACSGWRRSLYQA